MHVLNYNFSQNYTVAFVRALSPYVRAARAELASCTITQHVMRELKSTWKFVSISLVQLNCGAHHGDLFQCRPRGTYR